MKTAAVALIMACALTTARAAPVPKEQSGKPRFTLLYSGPIGDTLYSVYSSSVALTDLLETLAAREGATLGDIAVNGIRIRDGHTTGRGPAVPLNKAPLDEGIKSECRAFLDKLGETNKAACDAEIAEIQLKLDKLPLDAPERIKLFDRQHELRMKCRVIPRKQKWKRIGSDDAIRKMGVVIEYDGAD